MAEDEELEEKWRKDPLGGVLFGLALIVIAAIYVFRDQLPGEEWWPWILVGVGCIFLLEALIRTTSTRHRRPSFGTAIFGIILVAAGSGLVYGYEEIWPYIIIVVGVLVLIYYLRQSV